MIRHRNIEVSDATLECALYGAGDPVVLLANAGCSTGYFDDLACTLAASGLMAVCINMRGVGESHGPLHDATLHDLAADVAGVVEALGCGPAHLLGHAFGNLKIPLIVHTGPNTSAKSGCSCSIWEKRRMSGPSQSSRIVGMRS